MITDPAMKLAHALLRNAKKDKSWVWLERIAYGFSILVAVGSIWIYFNPDQITGKILRAIVDIASSNDRGFEGSRGLGWQWSFKLKANKTFGFKLIPLKAELSVIYGDSEANKLTSKFDVRDNVPAHHLQPISDTEVEKTLNLEKYTWCPPGLTGKEKIAKEGSIKKFISDPKEIKKVNLSITDWSFE